MIEAMFFVGLVFFSVHFSPLVYIFNLFFSMLTSLMDLWVISKIAYATASRGHRTIHYLYVLFFIYLYFNVYTLSCSWHKTTKQPILFPPILFTKFSQFEHFWVFHWSQTKKNLFWTNKKFVLYQLLKLRKICVINWENKISDLMVWCTNKIYIYVLYSCSNRLVVRHKTTLIDNFVPNYDWELI